MSGAGNVQASIVDASHGHTYSAHNGGIMNIHVGAIVGSNETSARPARRRHRRCPAPSPHYIRREIIETHMDGYFFGTWRGPKRYVLHGLGGSGKTEAAKAFVDRHYYNPQNPEGRRFSDVFWVDATSTQTIMESLQDIAAAKDIDVDDALTWFENCDGDDRNWIILFNNADDPELDISTYFPNCSHGNILITTRSSEAKRFSAGPGSAYTVGPMTESESEDLLLSHLKFEGPSSPSVVEDIDRLARLLGHFPLSLGQVGAFIAKTHLTPKKYLTMLQTRRKQLLQEQGKMKNPDKYEHTSIQAAWLISFERLSPAARQLLWICAFLYHDGILQTIFEYMCTGLSDYEEKYPRLFTEDERAAIAGLKAFREELLTDGSWDEFKFHQLISELQSYSLILFNPEQGTWSIHPLVHEWARNTLDAAQQVAMRQQVSILLSSARGRTDEEKAFDGLLALHVDEVLKDTTVTFNGCRNEFGFIYRAVRRWDEEVVLRAGYKEECERILGEEDNDTLESISDLAITYRNQGRLEDAAALQLRVMETRKRRLGEDHLDTLKSMINLGKVYRRQGRFDDAATLELEVMEARKRQLGDDHLDTLQSMTNLALTYRKQGRFNDAVILQLKVISALKMQIGDDHVDTLQSITNLAATYWKERRFDNAAILHLEVMEARKRKLGDDHLDTLQSMGNLASTYRNQGRLDDAAALELEVIKARKRKLGDDHLDTLLSVTNLAFTYRKQGRLDDAVTLIMEVIGARKRKLGDDHLDTLRSTADLAAMYWKQGRLDDAATLLLEVLEARKRKLEDDHLHILESKADLASIYKKQGRLDDAATLQLELVEAQKRKLGVDHLDTLQSILNLVHTYSKQGRLDDVAALQLEVVEARKRKLGDDHLDTLSSMTSLALTYRKQGRLDDAAALQSQAVEGLTQKLGDHSTTRQAVQTLQIINREIDARNRKARHSSTSRSATRKP